MPELHALLGNAGAAAVIIVLASVVVCGAVSLIWRLL